MNTATVYEMVKNGKAMHHKLVGIVETSKSPKMLAYHCSQKFNKKFCVIVWDKKAYSK